MMAGRNFDFIAIDLDGTLLGPDGRVSERNASAVRAARDAGLHVMVATGRGLAESSFALEAIGQTDPVTVAGGALTCDPVTGGTLDRRTMATELVELAVGAVHRERHAAVVLKDRAAAGYDYLVVRGKEGFEVDPITRWWFDKTGGTVREVELLSDDELPEMTIRVGVVAPQDEAAKIEADFKETLGERVLLHTFTALVSKEHASASGGRQTSLIEVFDKSAGKWPAVVREASRLGITPERVAAIGDETNDLDMVRGAGLGIAMGNAVDELKESANVIGPANGEDGVAVAIEKILDGSW